jgi:branched-chain amino acid transport system substrate-binding protein
MIQKSTLALIAAALVLAGVTAVRAQTALKIGYINTFSGPIGLLGQDMYDAFMLKIEQNGGKLGGVAVDVIKQDDQLKPEVAAQLA